MPRACSIFLNSEQRHDQVHAILLGCWDSCVSRGSCGSAGALPCLLGLLLSQFAGVPVDLLFFVLLRVFWGCSSPAGTTSARVGQPGKVSSIGQRPHAPSFVSCARALCVPGARIVSCCACTGRRMASSVAWFGQAGLDFAGALLPCTVEWSFAFACASSQGPWRA